ncbi:hypothetical protein [Streptomyces sp. WM6386]|uniref:hypothetical protein n=1 Tax=Streptomyces sp. WM6386 TaxID=1415558 RepID=UPI00061A0829|nr:hypothetical protein [Streptomyces sp. WM6386]KKD07465.1 hypothetical protein TN53_13330 [Streptomyces sp. WM6386]
MHRTTTTATLLVTVAVSALSGCVTVQHPSVAPGPPVAPSQPTAPRPDGRAEPQVVQAPAQEALQLIESSRKSGRSTPLPKEAPPSSAAAPAPGQQPHARPAHPHPGHPEAPRPHVEIPDVAGQVPKNPDVCKLGKQYGGWRKDSPEAVICERTYGR